MTDKTLHSPEKADMDRFLMTYQSSITTTTAQAIAKDLGVDLDLTDYDV